MVAQRSLLLATAILILFLTPITSQTPSLSDQNFMLAQDEMNFPIESEPDEFSIFQSNQSTHFSDMLVTPCGDTYVVGYGEEMTKSEYLLVKWGDNATLQWYRSWIDGESSRGLGVAYKDGFVFTVGRIETSEDEWNILLMKWDSDGNLIWKQESDWVEEIGHILRLAEMEKTIDIYIRNSRRRPLSIWIHIHPCKV